MLRTAGIVIPIYIILISVVTLLHRFNQQQVCKAHLVHSCIKRIFTVSFKMLIITQGVHEATPVLVPGGAEGLQSLQPVPPQQHVISIQ